MKRTRLISPVTGEEVCVPLAGDLSRVVVKLAWNYGSDALAADLRTGIEHEVATLRACKLTEAARSLQDNTDLVIAAVRNLDGVL